jgi:outer membrane biosynthesis protein TonB
VPRKTIYKIGLATAAAAVAAILAITSALAHGTPPTSGRSMVGTIVNAAVGASLVSFQDQPQTTVTVEQTADAEEAAELAAKIAAEQAALAAKLAAEQAEEAAEAAAAAAASTCVAADQTEDTAEKAGDQTEDSSEKTNGSESALEDSNEKTSAQAAEKAEAPEVKCAGADGDHKSGDNHESSTKTFSSEGDH